MEIPKWEQSDGGHFRQRTGAFSPTVCELVEERRFCAALSAPRDGALAPEVVFFAGEKTTTGPKGPQSLCRDAALKGPLFHGDFGRAVMARFRSMVRSTRSEGIAVEERRFSAALRRVWDSGFSP